MPARLRRRNAMSAFVRTFMPGAPGMGKRLAAIPRMIKATMKGEYDARFRLFLMTLASLYIISPLDLVPELFLALFGLIDDAFVVSWLFGTLLAETERFLEWERERAGGKVIPAEIIQR